MIKKIKKTMPMLVAAAMTLIIAGCGKHETAGGAAGAATGAVIGNAVSGKKHKATGTLLGALIGNYVGREAGRSEDRKEERLETNQKINSLKAQNRNLQRQLTKWCSECNRQVTIQSAQSCPDCGGGLIQEKFCKRCKTIFAPESGYRYCPYCSVRVALRGR